MPYGEVKTPLSLGYEGTNPPLTVNADPVYSDEYLKEKSLKYDYTLGEHSPGVQNLLQTARSGLVKQIATSVIDNDKLQDQKVKAGMLQEIASETKDQPLDPHVYDFVMGLTTDEIKESVNDPLWDANAVYAKKVANEQLNSDPYIWEEVFKNSQTEKVYHNNRDAAETHIAWRESLYDLMNEINADYEQKTVFGKGYEYFEQWVVPFASYFNKRNSVEGENVGNVMLGTNLEQQYRKLWSLPLPERYKVLRKAAMEIREDNVLDAAEFVQGALDYGRSQEQMDNLFTAVEIGTTLPIATVGKLAKGAKAGKGGVTTVNKMTGVVDSLVADSEDKASEMLTKKIRAKGRVVNTPSKTKPFNKVEVTVNGKRRPDVEATIKSSQAPGTVINVGNFGPRIVGFDNLHGTIRTKTGEIVKVSNANGLITDAAGNIYDISIIDHFKNGNSGWIEVNHKPLVPGTAPKAARGISMDDPRTSGDGTWDEEYAAEIGMKDIVQATDPANPNIISDTLAATGRSAEGAAVKAQKIPALETAKEPPKTVRATVERDSLTPSMYDTQAQKLPEPPITKITNALALRINEAMKKVGQSLDEAVFASKSVASRFSSEGMMQQAVKVAESDFARIFPKVGDAVIDVNMKTPEETLGNVVEVYTTFGRPDKTLFKKAMHAYYYGTRHYDLRKGSFDVIQVGNEFAIRMKTVADESKLSDYLIPTTGENSSPTSVANTFLGYLRTQDDLISKQSIENRKGVTHAYSFLQREIKEVADNIATIGKVPGRMARFERVLLEGLHAKRMVKVTVKDPETGKNVIKEKEVVGQEWDMAGFERKYMELNGGKLPSEAEILGYETYKKLLNFDLAIRNLDLYRDKAILGINEWRFKGLIQDAEGNTVKGWSNTFDGKLVDDLPYEHPEDTIVAIHSDVDGFTHVFDVKTLSEGNRNFIQKLREEGYRIIQIANPDVKPLSKMLKNDESINFVMVKESQASPLKFAQLPKMLGGHRIPNESHFVKKAKLTKAKRKVRNKDGVEEEIESNKTIYEGDITVAGVHSEAKAKEMVPLLQKAQDLFRAGDKEGFRRWVEKHLPREPDFLWNDFKTGVLGDVNQPFHVTKSGQGVNDTEGFRKAIANTPNFVDAIDSSFNLYRRLNKKFAGEKSPDLMSFSKAGTEEGNPVLRFKTARYIDPLQAMQTSMSSLMRNRAFSDYIIHSTNSWIEEFGDLLNVPREQLRANPVHHLHNPQWIDKPVSRDRLAAAKNARLAITNLLGTQSDLKNNVDWLKGKAIDAVYNKLGDKASEKVSDWILPTESDPLAYVRKFAFHTKLGMLNPLQIWTQSQTLFHMAALTGNPLRAGSAYVNAAYMQALQMTDDPKIIEAIANMAAKSGGGSADEFLESFNVMKKSGLWYVEGEHGWVNDVLDPDIFEGSMGKMLNKAAVFFRGTERFVRLSSWSIAYKEWKAANPGKVLNKRADINKVLARQDILSLNMTNASAANLQKGVFSLSTQFFGYQMRILDQMLGKRLTKAEKLRVLSTYSLMYGVPVGGGMGLVSPWFSDVMEYAERNGIKTDEGAAQLFFQGGLSFLTEWALGDEYNPGVRYGPGGFTFVKNLLDDGFGQDGLLTLMGASTGILMDTARWMQPALTGLWSNTVNDEEDAIPLETQDFIDAFRSISTVNNGVKAYMAMYYNGYYTRDGKKVATVDDVDAVAIGLFGLTPSSIDTMYRQMEFLKEDKTTMDTFKKEYVKNLRKAVRATGKADRQLYLKRARIMLQSSKADTREAAKWFQEALKGDEALIMDIDKEYRELIEKRNKP